jgi:hypothetical protein
VSARLQERPNKEVLRREVFQACVKLVRFVINPGWVGPWDLEQVFEGVLVWCPLESVTKPLVVKVSDRSLLFNQVLWYLWFEYGGMVLLKFLDEPLSRG